jgi:hypothetical protein
MTPRIRLAAIVLCLLGTLGSASEQREAAFVVIVHPSNHYDALNRSKLEFLFLRKVSRWPWGAEAQPVDMDPRSLAAREFTSQVLKTTEESLAVYWIDQRSTRGASRPIQIPSAAAVKAFVAAHPGAVGYIPAADLDSTVKTIRVDP